MPRLRNQRSQVFEEGIVLLYYTFLKVPSSVWRIWNLHYETDCYFCKMYVFTFFIKSTTMYSLIKLKLLYDTTRTFLTWNAAELFFSTTNSSEHALINFVYLLKWNVFWAIFVSFIRMPEFEENNKLRTGKAWISHFFFSCCIRKVMSLWERE